MTFKPMEIPITETDRLKLRGWSETDHQIICDIWSGEENARFIGGELSRWDAWRQLAAIQGHWNMRGFGAFCIEEKNTGKGVGWGGPWFPYAWHEHEICYSLVPEAQGKGYATEAVRAFVKYAYQDLGWQTAVSYIDAENTASQSVARRLGAFNDGDTDLDERFYVQIWRYPSRRSRSGMV